MDLEKVERLAIEFGLRYSHLPIKNLREMIQNPITEKDEEFEDYKLILRIKKMNLDREIEALNKFWETVYFYLLSNDNKKVLIEKLLEKYGNKENFLEIATQRIAYESNQQSFISIMIYDYKEPFMMSRLMSKAELISIYYYLESKKEILEEIRNKEREEFKDLFVVAEVSFYDIIKSSSISIWDDDKIEKRFQAIIDSPNTKLYDKEEEFRRIIRDLIVVKKIAQAKAEVGLELGEVFNCDPDELLERRKIKEWVDFKGQLRRENKSEIKCSLCGKNLSKRVDDLGWSGVETIYVYRDVPKFEKPEDVLFLCNTLEDLKTCKTQDEINKFYDQFEYIDMSSESFTVYKKDLDKFKKEQPKIYEEKIKPFIIYVLRF